MIKIGRAAALAATGLTLAAAAPSAALAGGTVDVPVTCGDTITKPGGYVLTEDCTGAGITIQADNVKLSLGYNTIRQGDAFAEAGIVVGPVADAVVSRGTIEGFEGGVLLNRSRAPSVESINVVQAAGGIIGEMDNALIQDNTILDSFTGILVTGNDNVIRGNLLGAAAVGIMLSPGERHSSNGNHVEGNRVVGSTVGILLEACLLDPCPAGPASYNEVRDNVADAGEVGISLRSGASFNRIEGNRANDNEVAGISVELESRGNVLTRNVARGNAQVDLLDPNPTCVNEWTDNEYGTFIHTCNA